TSTMEVCARIATRLHMPQSVQDAVANIGELWDGSGTPRGLRGDEIPVTSQVIFAAMGLQIMHKYRGREVARRFAERQREKQLGPKISDAFLMLAQEPRFWEGLESPSISEIVRGLEPDTELATFPEDRFDDVTLAFADFIDLKSPFSAAHSRRVAEVSAKIAGLVGCPPDDSRAIRGAGLMHDLGIVAVPAFILNRPQARLNSSEAEAVRLHPYYGERILDRCPAFSAIKPVVGAHHERVDGKGFYRGLKGRDIPIGARIVAVADRLDELVHDHPGQPALDIRSALEVLGQEGGAALDRDIVNAVRGSFGEALPERREPREWPAGLSNREVEVLRLASAGLTRKQVAVRLGITENTVRHHLEHIYNKTGTSTRVAATLFAIENNLIL
ncbi:MAG TPA: HD domain-containing phosphohydrolase, partial [Dehalococcoidia bacterium]